MNDGSNRGWRAGSSEMVFPQASCSKVGDPSQTKKTLKEKEKKKSKNPGTETLKKMEIS